MKNEIENPIELCYTISEWIKHALDPWRTEKTLRYCLHSVVINGKEIYNRDSEKNHHAHNKKLSYTMLNMLLDYTSDDVLENCKKMYRNRKKQPEPEKDELLKFDINPQITYILPR